PRPRKRRFQYEAHRYSFCPRSRATQRRSDFSDSQADDCGYPAANVLSLPTSCLDPEKGDFNMKRIVIRFALALALLSAGAISRTPKPTTADIPLPTCFPCPPAA